MKLSANVILGSIISIVLLFMIFWTVNIQTETDYDPTKHTLKDEIEEKLDPLLLLSMERGKDLWINEGCIRCHKLTAKDGFLRGLKERWEIQWLIQYIKDEQILIDQKDPDVITLNAEWNSNKSEHSNPNLSEKDIMDILSYVDGY
ncbi:c-type cytochrome [Tenacibaculum agarivorans]|uniref:c-type cytochrome n=1 Tax=Tenacibaculum agarivorans TaxID=1908389 RepID=UPI0009F9DD39|nr:c-type cytochrome [Tenacibaculum agarivorans]